MTIFPESLLGHLAGEATTVCHCWRLTRRDGTVLGFTDHDCALTVDGQLYRPETGFSGSEAKASLGLAIDTADVEGVLSADVIADADIDAGLYDEATVETLMADWKNPAAFATLRFATIGKIERRDGRFVAELESAAQALDRPNGRTVRRNCDAELGDSRCQVSLAAAAFRGTGIVSAAEASGAILAAGLDAFSAGWFANGVLTWTSGALAGRASRVIAHDKRADVAALAFWSPVGGVAAGDGFDIVAGCDKQFKTCREKFYNSLNFQGFPHLPGNDAAYGYVSGGQAFDGGVLVP